MVTLLNILKYWKFLLFGTLVALLLGASMYITELRNDKAKLQQKFNTYEQQVREANLTQQVEQARKDLETSQKLITIEVQHNEQVKKLHTDLANANSATRSLSEQLANAKTRIEKASLDEVKAYSVVLTDTFRDCTGAYTEMAARVDEYKLNASKVTDQYNTLVDYLNSEEKDDN